MAIMYPTNLNEYMPTDSERDVYLALKNQLPDSFTVFYSVAWTTARKSQMEKSEADFVIVDPRYGYLCLEVKGGSKIWIDGEDWYISDGFYGDRKLSKSPYQQAELSMYYFRDAFRNKYHTKFHGLYAAGVVLPYFKIGDDFNINHRDRIVTIDASELNNLSSKIKAIFKAYGGERFNSLFYPENENNLLLSLIKEHLALDAAAGALVKYKARQLAVINRVQDNYINFITNVRQFYLKGGAGTGKTWIAMKMAKREAEKGLRSMYLCVSPFLAEWVIPIVGPNVDVYSLAGLFSNCLVGFSSLEESDVAALQYNPSFTKYDAIFVDEAQDFTSGWAQKVRGLLRSTEYSRFGVFYDEVQVLKENSFGDGFGIVLPPFLLNENIRNTASIYKWTAEKTRLGMDVIANPVEGPTPETYIVHEKGQLTIRLEELLIHLIDDGGVSTQNIALLLDDLSGFLALYPNGLAKWKFSDEVPSDNLNIRISSVTDFKGMEADVVIYVHSSNSSGNMNYVAYTRARYYLIEFVEVIQ